MLEQHPYRFTYDDYSEMPDEERYELIEGDLIRLTPAPSLFHQRILGRLFLALQLYLREHPLGEVLLAPVDVLLSEHNCLQPDLIFVVADRREILEERYCRGCPDLVVEILSPSTSKRDQGIKKLLYARFGARQYWMIDPERRNLTIHAHDRAGEQVFAKGQLVSSALFPGLEFRVEELFSAQL